MNQDNLNTVRKNYKYYCALRSKIFDAQDKESVLEHDPLVKEYFEVEDLINYYSDEYYFEKKEKELEELKNEEKVREYIQTNLQCRFRPIHGLRLKYENQARGVFRKPIGA